MLTQIKLTNFKCFKQETTFPLSQFNLFTGVNGSGKSTVLQALLLMRQSIEHDMYTTRLLLNGSCVNLGSFEEVRNREISVSEPIFFEFSLKNANSENTITYRSDRTYRGCRRFANSRNSDTAADFLKFWFWATLLALSSRFS